MPIPRTPLVSYFNPEQARQARFHETEQTIPETNEPPADRPTSQHHQDNRSVQGERQASAAGDKRQAEYGYIRDQTETRPDQYGTGSRQDPPESANTQVRRGIGYIDNKSDQLEKSVEKFESDWKDVPERVDGTESAMATIAPQFDELKQTRVNHSARIHALEDEVRTVKLQNRVLQTEFMRRGEAQDPGHPDRPHAARQYRTPPLQPEQSGWQIPPQRSVDGREGYDQGQSHGQGHGQGQGQDQQRGRRVFGNEQHNVHHGRGDGYLGFNKIYNPEFATSYRREQATVEYAKSGKLPGQEEEWNRKRREEEEIFLQEKPKTYAYTAPYQSQLPPDVNKFFHDTKYLQERPATHPDMYTAVDGDVPLRSNPGTTYEVSYLSPRGQKQPMQAGGLYFIRYHDSGFPDVCLALREQQTVMHSHKGHILGIARANNILVLEGEADWTPGRKTTPRPQFGVPNFAVDDSVAMLWFPGLERAADFSNNSFKNRFRNMDFPTPQSAEMIFVPMVTPLYNRELDTFFAFEFTNAKRYPPENLQRFEEEVRQRILEFNPNCIPFVASCMLTGKEGLKRASRGQLFRPQSKLFISRFSSLTDVVNLWQSVVKEGLKGASRGQLFRPQSKMFTSRFSSVTDVVNLWQSGIIQRARQDWSLNGPANIFAIALKDFTD